MLEFSISNGRGSLRIIRPLVDESEESFRRRMDALTQVLAERAPNLIALVVHDSDGSPVCVVSQRMSCDPRPRPAEGGR